MTPKLVQQFLIALRRRFDRGPPRPSSGASPAVLYHCMLHQPRGDAIEPTCEREVNGRTAQFLFATPHLTKALAFAFDYYAGEIICNGPIEGSDGEFAIICDRATTLSTPRRALVYAFTPEEFEELDPGTDSRQYVSTKPVPFACTTLALTINSVDDLMRNGLQIFSSPRTLDDLLQAGFLERDCTNDEWLKQLVHDGTLRWENVERGLAPDPVLRKIISGCPEVAPRQTPPATKNR